MGFWEKDFLNRRRQEWMESIHKFQYQVNGKWYDAKINSKKITGNKIVFIVSLLTTPKTAHTITGIRLWDITGRICGGLEVAVKRTANQYEPVLLPSKYSGNTFIPIHLLSRKLGIQI